MCPWTVSSHMEMVFTMNAVYEWQRHYEAAILETNPERLPQLIQVAQRAISTRMAQLGADHEASEDEKQAILDALAGLKVLQREVH